MAKKPISLITEPTEFFKDELLRASAKFKLELDPHTEYYLVDLLMRFMDAENFFAIDENGNRRNETLALLLGEAAHATDPEKKKEDLRRLGDVTLYTAGFFADSLARKTVDVDYYISMGRSAYSNLSSLILDSTFRSVFNTLSSGFNRFVDVFGELSVNHSLTDTKNILRNYELWLKTGSERAESALKDAGIIPNKRIKISVQ